MILFRPTPADLPRLKEPFGRLFPGEPDETMLALREFIDRNRPSRTTAVGDVVSKATLAARIRVNLRIVDKMSMRKPATPFKFSAGRSYAVRNPAGTITQESWDAIRRAMKEDDVLILVKGEEDLLTLPSIVESPDDSLVLYGQPSQGLVVVETTPAAKEEARLILGRMTTENTQIPGP